MAILSSNLSVYLPVVLPHLFERKDLMDRFMSALEELYMLVGTMRIVFENGHESYLRIASHKNAEDLPEFKQVWGEGSASPYSDHWFLHVSADIEFSDSDVERYIGRQVDTSHSDMIDAYLSLAGRQVEKTVSDIFLALNIAKAGLVTCSRGALFSESQFRNHVRGMQNMFFQASKTARELGWPQIRELELSQVWNWLNSFDFLKSNFGAGPVGRAIASMTHLMKDTVAEAVNAVTLDIVWVLLGLEALYCKGDIELKTQVLEKASAFLGDPQERKEKFGFVYDYRSRLVHGAMDIPFRYAAYDGHRDNDKLSKSVEESRMIALAVLIASIHKLIVEGRNQLHFKYHLSQ